MTSKVISQDEAPTPLSSEFVREIDRMLSENSIGQAQSMHQLLGGKSKVSDVRSLIENNKT